MQLYFRYTTNTEESYISDTMVQWGLSSAEKVYAVLNTLDWLIQDFYLGGVTSTLYPQELGSGWDSKLIEEASSYDLWNTSSFRQGDAIVYNHKISPF